MKLADKLSKYITYNDFVDWGCEIILYDIDGNIVDDIWKDEGVYFEHIIKYKKIYVVKMKRFPFSRKYKKVKGKLKKIITENYWYVHHIRLIPIEETNVNKISINVVKEVDGIFYNGNDRMYRLNKIPSVLLK